MRIFAYYDLEGNIHSLIRVDAAEGAFALRTPRPGQLVAEIEIGGIELESDASDPEALSKTLFEIAESYRVTPPLPRLKLSRKPGK